jgi:UDP-N-acetylmuramoyl-L-alanyl-D-glutamate--2,6-diaminopimelate ligase
MTLRDLLFGVTAESVAEVPVRGIVCHSKQVRAGDLFVAVQGPASDGHDYISEAVERGAAAVIAQRLPMQQFKTASRACPCVVVRDTHEALVKIAQRFYGKPAEKIKLVGATGTNGKTTTTYLLHSIIEAAGQPSGLLGSIKYKIGSRELPSRNTTPGTLELQRLFAQMVGEGLGWCAMEVSSHALAQGRIDGLAFDAAIFTNLGSDHLDYHHTREAYAAAKRRLFEYLKKDGVAVINADDAYGRTLSETLPHAHVLTYGTEHPAKVFVETIQCSWAGLRLVFKTPWGAFEAQTALVGRHNASNVAAAVAALMALGVRPEAIQAGLAALNGIPGRLERIPNDLGINIVIDYAHTDDALRLVLRSLRELGQGRIVAVFGAGGDRDQGKRPKMGRVASVLADYVVLTSDNPRSEDPQKILEQIRGGFSSSFDQYQQIVDRQEAIATALSLAKAGDTVLIAGKGHEAYQIFGNVAVPFVDRQVVEAWLASMHAVSI